MMTYKKKTATVSNLFYEKVGTSKLLTTAGVGAIVETLSGALEVLPIDQWPYFTEHNNKITATGFEINEPRLLNRLKENEGFNQIEKLVHLPATEGAFGGGNIPGEKDVNAAVHYFPTWFYCPNCHSFHPIREWYGKWESVVRGARGNDIPDRIAKFWKEPVCAYCYENTKLNNTKNSRHRLVQVPFVLVAGDGEMRDIPWELWNQVEKKGSGDETDTVTMLFDKKKCCSTESNDKIQLLKFYRRGVDQASMSVKCSTCGSERNLTGLFNLRIGRSDEIAKPYPFRPMVRSSTAIHFPVTVRSLYIPVRGGISEDDCNLIMGSFNSGMSNPENIAQYVLHNRHTSEQVQAVLDGAPVDPAQYKELDYREAEFRYLSSCSKKEEERSDNGDSLLLTISPVKLDSNSNLFKLWRLDRLQMTTLQTGFTRQQPIQPEYDDGLSDSEEGSPKAPILIRRTSKDGDSVKILPALQSFGEGLFISLDTELLNSWIEKNLSNDDFAYRIKSLHVRSRNSNRTKGRFKAPEDLLWFMLIHTLSHQLIREFEFAVGYSASSLSERLYADRSRSMAGILIYTVGGQQGSLGGLSSQGEPSQFSELLASAINRAESCSSDPICGEKVRSQGVDGLNLAACWSCALLPETSCEEFNLLLDRVSLNEFFRGII